METIFKAVYDALVWLSREWHTTYNAVNVIVYYLLVPLSWTVLVDILLRRPYTSPVLLLIWLALIIINRGCFTQWCDSVFDKSVAFLLAFHKIGWNYTVSSVIICVVLPLAIYLLLLALLITKH